MVSVLAVALASLVVNLPLGYWRAGLRKFTPAWFVAVHAAVPLVIALRYFSGLGFQWATLPIFVVAYSTGQFLGGRLRG